jgi:ATP/maltotriose-dependent transcriptional regulator MalT
MAGRDDAIEYAHQLADALNQIGADLPERFEGLFVLQARRVGESAHGDLGALLMVECLEARQAGRALDAAEVRRALDRVRHRLIREASGQRRRFRQLADSDVVERHGSMVGQGVDNLDTIHLLLSGLTARESLVLELFAEGRNSEEIGVRLGASPAAVRQSLSRIRKKLRERYPILGD